MFGVVVHGLRANLNFNRAPGFVADHSVQGLVAVGLRLGDVVVKLFFQRCKLLMHPGQRCIAVLDRRHDDAHGANVEELIKA